MQSPDSSKMIASELHCKMDAFHKMSTTTLDYFLFLNSMYEFLLAKLKFQKKKKVDNWPQEIGNS